MKRPEPHAPSGVTTGQRSRPTHVLAFHIGSLGDTVLTIPALIALRNGLGADATITLLHDAGLSGRVSPTDVVPPGLVDDVISFPGPGERRLGRIGRLVAQLRRRHFDAVVNLALADRPAKTLKRDRIFFRLAGITSSYGFEPTPPGRSEARVRLDRVIELVGHHDLGEGPWLEPADPARADVQRWWSAARPGAGDHPADTPSITMGPGTLMNAKRWPSERWIELGRRVRSDLDMVPIVVGGPADRSEGEALVAAWGGGANAAGHLDPRASAALLAQAQVHVGVDTGTTHLAAAVGTPVVALYSHRAPLEQWAPLGRGHQILDHAVPCDGCFEIECPILEHPCMTGITVDEVWRALLAEVRPDSGVAPKPDPGTPARTTS